MIAVEVFIYLNIYPSGTTLHGSKEEADRLACSNRVGCQERKVWATLVNNRNSSTLGDRMEGVSP